MADVSILIEIFAIFCNMEDSLYGLAWLRKKIFSPHRTNCFVAACMYGGLYGERNCRWRDIWAGVLVELAFGQLANRFAIRRINIVSDFSRTSMRGQKTKWSQKSINKSVGSLRTGSAGASTTVTVFPLPYARKDSLEDLHRHISWNFFFFD